MSTIDTSRLAVEVSGERAAGGLDLLDALADLLANAPEDGAREKSPAAADEAYGRAQLHGGLK
jgi:hypothetical protein